MRDRTASKAPNSQSAAANRQNAASNSQSVSRPDNVTKLRRFLGLPNFYRRSIRGAAAILAPLNAYLTSSKKNDKTSILWNPDADFAFEKIKTEIDNVALLFHPEHDAETRLITDAADFGMGAALEQFISVLKTEKSSPRQQRQLSFVSEFSTRIKHLSGSDNVVADALSKIDLIKLFSEIDFSERFVWPEMHKQISKFCKACLDCQRAKISRHNIVLPAQFVAPESRFEHIHMDIVGPLPIDNEFRYCLTLIDRFSRWPGAIPIKNIEAATVAHAFVNTWISRYGTLKTITTDQGT
ncbi:uncharacterized protein LOC122504828 [Leptopilina heterotoma]|uniref:uncharacterized protein LOC122504828 n=1 Tax=Leptopilina heterotoma TaxID=63436 RepID=UPI001CA7D006|nr:uncharacterized protein LOC122504828 [Leptopilina heterotoma]